MIHLVYGEDAFRVRERVKELKEKAEKSGAESTIIDGKELSAETLAERLHGGNLFGKRNILIIRNLLSHGSAALKERAVYFFERMPKDADVILWEEDVPDRRTALFRLLQRRASVSEMLPLKGRTLFEWIKNRARFMGINIADKAALVLAESTGADLAQVEQELNKLAIYAGDRLVTEEDVTKLVAGSVPPTIFELLDKLGSDSYGACILIERLLAAGEEPLYLLSMLAYQVRGLLLVTDLRLQDERTNSATVARKLGMHPFVAQKTLQQSQRFSMEELVRLHRRLTEIDLQIKTGSIYPVDALFVITGRQAPASGGLSFY